MYVVKQSSPIICPSWSAFILQLTLKQIKALYTLGQFQYSYRNYTGAANYLYHFRVLSTDNDLNNSAHWGKLASDILTGRWEVALEELRVNTLREAIASRTSSSILASASANTKNLREPALHNFTRARGSSTGTSLSISTTQRRGHSSSRHPLLQATSTSFKLFAHGYYDTSPLLPYYCIKPPPASQVQLPQRPYPLASDTQSKTQPRLSKWKNISTPTATSFLKELYIEFDFGAAQRELTLAEEVVRNDFFPRKVKDEFLDSAQYPISEAYCRIHQKINIANLSERLNFSQEEGEKWIVNLIWETRMGADAKIDLEKVRHLFISCFFYAHHIIKMSSR